MFTWSNCRTFVMSCIVFVIGKSLRKANGECLMTGEMLKEIFGSGISLCCNILGALQKVKDIVTQNITPQLTLL